MGDGTWLVLNLDPSPFALIALPSFIYSSVTPMWAWRNRCHEEL